MIIIIGSQLWDAARSQLHAAELGDTPEYLIEIVNTACRKVVVVVAARH